MARKPEINFIGEDFKKYDYILLTKIYENAKQKLDCVCPNEHYHSISWSNWKQGKRCPYCSGRIKPTIEFIQEDFRSNGYVLTSTEYKNSQTKLEYICPNDHHHSISWNSWQQGHRCPYCYGNMKSTIEFIRFSFEKENYFLLTTKYVGCGQKLEYLCSNGHRHSISWDSWKQGHRCPYCCGNVKLTIDFIREQFEKEGYILLTTKYEGNKQKLEYICPNGHKHSISWHKWQKGRRCPFCMIKVSKWEKQIKNFLDIICVSYMANDRTQLINPSTNCFLELDIWLPQLSKAIECNGVYWHNRDEVAKNDKIKRQLCRQQGIDLLVITDEEWNNNREGCNNKIKTFVCGVV